MAKKKIIKDNHTPLIEAIVEGIQEKKGKDIVSLDIRELKSSVTDFFVICHAENTRQVKALADSVEEFTRKNLDEKPWHTEGSENANWILLDYVNVVVHVAVKHPLA